MTPPWMIWKVAVTKLHSSLFKGGRRRGEGTEGRKGREGGGKEKEREGQRKRKLRERKAVKGGESLLWIQVLSTIRARLLTDPAS